MYVSYLILSSHSSCIVAAPFSPPAFARETYGSIVDVIAADQTLQLILDLQRCALAAGHERPLLIAIDQENGSLNSLAEDSITQFPPAMGVAAGSRPEVAREIALATAQEMGCLGFNWILGPVLDVLSSARAQHIAVRALGDDAAKVSLYGKEMARGYDEGGLACCGKHFPSYGDVDYSQPSPFSNPTVSQHMGQLRQSSLIPFAAAIENGLSAMFVGGCVMTGFDEPIPHACLSERVVTQILRKELGFNGVAVSECLLMEDIYEEAERDVWKRAIAAVKAGCDQIMMCQAFRAQLNVVESLRTSILAGELALERIEISVKRVTSLKDKYTSWQQAMYPAGLSALQDLKVTHRQLSIQAYQSAISLVRDHSNHLELFRQIFSRGQEILLLTPLLELFPSTATKMVSSGAPIQWGVHFKDLSPGEGVFQYFGEQLAKTQGSRILHASYSSNGVRPHHEHLVSRAAAVIVISADATRNTYQYGFAKHVNLLCKFSGQQPLQDVEQSGQIKPLIVVAVSSPWDFLSDPDISTYICTYDFSRLSLETLAGLIRGTFTPQGVPPLAVARRRKRRRSCDDTSTSAETVGVGS